MIPFCSSKTLKKEGKRQLLFVACVQKKTGKTQERATSKILVPDELDADKKFSTEKKELGPFFFFLFVRSTMQDSLPGYSTDIRNLLTDFQKVFSTSFSFYFSFSSLFFFFFFPLYFF
jgi:hypothetical protein